VEKEKALSSINAKSPSKRLFQKDSIRLAARCTIVVAWAGESFSASVL
jgi:hypothetical protein